MYLITVKIKWNEITDRRHRVSCCVHYGKILAPFSFLWPLCFSLILHILIHSISSPPWATRGGLTGFHFGVIYCLTLFPSPHSCDHVTVLDPLIKYRWLTVVCACPYSCSTSDLFPTMQSNCSFIGDAGSWPKILEWLLSNILVKTKLLSVAFKHLYELTPAYFLSLGSSCFSFHPKDIHVRMHMRTHTHMCAWAHAAALWSSQKPVFL